MTIYIYHIPKKENLPGYTYASTLSEAGQKHLIQTIQAEPTNLSITESFTGDGVEIGEVFQYNSVIENLIRVS